MKKVGLILVIVMLILPIITACPTPPPLANGEYEKTGDGVGLGADEFTVNGSTLTIGIMGGVLGSVEYSYAIDGDEIKLTAQGGTLSYPFEKVSATEVIIN
ncbi:MAG: hypothetical protein LBS21_00970, partial [Clostridiales bacterium]|nr:hypothetical protein [Clostridiales bacterium]